jgi:hypothetical protein
MRSALERPGVLDDLSSAFDSPQLDVAGWIALVRELVLVKGSELARLAGDGPMITDDRPLPEYFLLRRTFGTASPQATPDLIRELAEAARR